MNIPFRPGLKFLLRSCVRKRQRIALYVANPPVDPLERGSVAPWRVLAKSVFTLTSHHALQWVSCLVESQEGLETKVGLMADLLDRGISRDMSSSAGVPHELTTLPSDRKVEFSRELVSGAKPIFRTPYRMVQEELRELTKQLQELLQQEYIHPTIIAFQFRTIAPYLHSESATAMELRARKVLAAIDYDMPELISDDLIMGSELCLWSPTVALHDGQRRNKPLKF
ncbi:hypothetical protein M9H77_31201 [Catharanthus roseus]|uniref:Uncharacterized protein n=1 Tax=Catharanthus roseus TaxID=4058 RepID=A0ACC0A1H0_CATRO|nr:hypothetical protein M9H77_31201 [Catharanthus roseus]